MLFAAFPNLAANLTPVAEAYGRKPLTLPSSTRAIILDSHALIEAALSSLLSPLDVNPNATLIIGFDAEWNVNRTNGVSIIQLLAESHMDEIYLIPVRVIEAMYNFVYIINSDDVD